MGEEQHKHQRARRRLAEAERLTTGGRARL
jgi:hypothetical protein